MKRRNFITLLGGAAAWPVAARGQQAIPVMGAAVAQQFSMPVVGFLSGRSLASDTDVVAAFLLALNESGFINGQNAAGRQLDRRNGDHECD